MSVGARVRLRRSSGCHRRGGKGLGFDGGDLWHGLYRLIVGGEPFADHAVGITIISPWHPLRQKALAGAVGTTHPRLSGCLSFSTVSIDGWGDWRRRRVHSYGGRRRDRGGRDGRRGDFRHLRSHGGRALRWEALAHYSISISITGVGNQRGWESMAWARATLNSWRTRRFSLFAGCVCQRHG